MCLKAFGIAGKSPGYLVREEDEACVPEDVEAEAMNQLKIPISTFFTPPLSLQPVATSPRRLPSSIAR